MQLQPTNRLIQRLSTLFIVQVVLAAITNQPVSPAAAVRYSAQPQTLLEDGIYSLKGNLKNRITNQDVKEYGRNACVRQIWTRLSFFNNGIFVKYVFVCTGCSLFIVFFLKILRSF